MSDYTNVIIRFGVRTRYYSELMEIDLSQIEPYKETISTSLKTPNWYGKEYTSGFNDHKRNRDRTRRDHTDQEILLQAPLDTWIELYEKKILRFIDERGYKRSFAKKILNGIRKDLSNHKSKFKNTYKGKAFN